MCVYICVNKGTFTLVAHVRSRIFRPVARKTIFNEARNEKIRKEKEDERKEKKTKRKKEIKNKEEEKQEGVI